MEFKKVFEWLSDDMPETTPAVVFVSECGVVKCGQYKMWSKKNKGYSVRKERTYKPYYNRGKQRNDSAERKKKYGQGYACVTIRDKTYSCHRLVALAWLPNPESKPQVNHKNGIRDDNRASNLEWVTNLENRQHADKYLHRDMPRGSRSGMAKLNESDVAEIKQLISSQQFYGKDIAKMYGVSPSNITSIKTGGTWTHV